VALSDNAMTPSPGTFRATPFRLQMMFVGTILLSAFLLFAIQPMFTRMVLPQLGGSPAVWSVAMVFFQTLLLLGYLYAHLSTRFLSHRAAVLTHALLLVSAFALLPIAISERFGAPPETGQSLWLIALFLSSVGLPFFALSATAPLLQAWFGRSDHPSASNPYFLYAASNIGSFAALLSYPLGIEPFLAVSTQTQVWTVLFAALALGLAACGFLVTPRQQADVASANMAAAPAVTLQNRLVWTGLAAVPSGLLVAVTAHLTTDVASAPLLWVAPLALFLLTFVLVFKDNPVIKDMILVKSVCYIMPFVMMSAMGFILPLSVQFFLHLGALLLISMLCHRQLYIKRPHASHLTEFYLWMSFGGMIGGLFAGLLAPVMFKTVLEYPLLLIAAVLCLPMPATAKPLRDQVVIAGFLIVLGALLMLLAPRLSQLLADNYKPFVMVVFAGAMGVVIGHKLGVLASAGALVGAMLMFSPIINGSRELAVRSFFGVNYVRIGFEGEARVLAHGSTVHGAVRIKDANGNPVSGRPEATTYYHDKGGINLALRAAREVAGGQLGDVAVLGLGAGAMACQAKSGETWTYFEIDKEVADLAKRKDVFPFLSSCTPDARVVLGDARLTLQNEKGKFDVIILDAFSSDAVPAHLLTKEAYAVYMRHLKPGGMIISHVSNRHLELSSVVEAAAVVHNFRSATGRTSADGNDPVQKRQFATPTLVVALSQNQASLDVLIREQNWTGPRQDAVRSLWTDDYANIIGAMWRQQK
jgi:spermidine synthase